MDPKGLAYFAAGIGAGLTIMGGAACCTFRYSYEDEPPQR